MEVSSADQVMFEAQRLSGFLTHIAGIDYKGILVVVNCIATPLVVSPCLPTTSPTSASQPLCGASTLGWQHENDQQNTNNNSNNNDETVYGNHPQYHREYKFTLSRDTTNGDQNEEPFHTFQLRYSQLRHRLIGDRWEMSRAMAKSGLCFPSAGWAWADYVHNEILASSEFHNRIDCPEEPSTSRDILKELGSERAKRALAAQQAALVQKKNVETQIRLDVSRAQTFSHRTTTNDSDLGYSRPILKYHYRITLKLSEQVIGAGLALITGPPNGVTWFRRCPASGVAAMLLGGTEEFMIESARHGETLMYLRQQFQYMKYVYNIYQRDPTPTSSNEYLLRIERHSRLLDLVGTYTILTRNRLADERITVDGEGWGNFTFHRNGLVACTVRVDRLSLTNSCDVMIEANEDIVLWISVVCAVKRIECLVSKASSAAMMSGV